MPTYTIDGKKYKSEVPLSNDELEELASSANEPSVYAEAARRGAARFVSPIYGAFKGALKGEGQTGARKYTEEARDYIVGMLGGTGALPKTQGERILAAGVEAAADPTSYIMPGGSFTQGAGMLYKPLTKLVESAAAGSGAEAGGIFGEYAGEKIGGETGAKIGRGVGALSGGMLAATATGALPRTMALVSPATKKVASLINKVRGSEPLEVSEQIADRHINNIFIDAAKADPKFADVLEEAINIQNRTGVKMPLSAMMKDNAVINAYIGHLATRHPEFRESFAKQFDELHSVLGKKTTSLFGDVKNADDFLISAAARKTADMDDIAKAATRKMSDIGRKAASIVDDIDQVNPAEFGSKVIKVVDNAEGAARVATSKDYSKAFAIAKSKGVELPESSVDDIYQTVVTGKNSDIFATFPSIYAKVKNLFAPKMVQGAGLVDEQGKLLSPDKTKFSAASVEDLDSLKREINLQLRSARTDSHIRVLRNLKEKVDQHIDELDPEFVSAYRNADKSYLARVGLPFNAETIKSIERAKFNENIVPLLTKNKSTINQFVSTTGDEGKRLVENAFVSEMTKFVKDGVLDVKRASAWLASKREALDIVPDVRDRLHAMVKDTNTLLSKKDAIDAALDAATKSRILLKENMSAQAITGQMYSSPQYTARFLQQYGNDKDAMRAIRSFMLDDIIKSSNPVQTLGDRTRAGVYDAVFGKTYKQVVSDLASISDRITKDPSAVAVNVKGLDADILTKLTGTKPERFLSLFYTNPVVSKHVAVVTVLNRFLNKKAGDIAEKKMMDLMLDKNASAKLLYSINTALGTKDANAIGDFAEWAGKRGYDFVKMLRQDIEAGAMRSYGGMDTQKLATDEDQQ